MIPEFTEFIRIFDQKDKTAADRAFAHSLRVIAVLEAAKDWHALRKKQKKQNRKIKN